MSHVWRSRSTLPLWDPPAVPFLHDSASFTPAGRRLLVSMGVIEKDPLRVAAEEWLAGHRGPMTEAVREVRRTLGPPVPEQWLESARQMRGAK